MSKNKILILFSHPLYEKSNANKALVHHVPVSKNITFHDLYEEYPDFDIDVKKEQQLLTQHNIIIWHHPMYWYSCPPLMKQWIDMVLEFGWAYGKKGNALQDKIVFQVITTGGDKDNYYDSERDLYTIPHLLEPFKQTAKVCNMEYLSPFVVHGTHNMTKEEYQRNGLIYGYLLKYMENHDLNITEIMQHHCINDWFATIRV